MMTERQQQAAALAREIQKMGAWVTTPLPLDDSKRLRFQVLDSDRDKVLEKLSSWNWSPILVSALPRICTDGWKLASVYEIDLPRERAPVYDDRIIRGEIVSRDKPSAETVAMLKDWYGK